MCLCALVCKRRTGRYTTRQMLAELHSALRSMVAEEQDTKLYATVATVARIVSPCAPEALIESRCTRHGHLACRRLCRMCLRARIRTQSLRLGLRASFGAHRKPRAAPPAQMGRGNPRVGERVAASGGARAAQRTALDAYMQCTDPTGSIRAALGMCSASALEGMGAAAAAAAAATLEYCVSSTRAHERLSFGVRGTDSTGAIGEDEQRRRGQGARAKAAGRRDASARPDARAGRRGRSRS